MELMKALWKHRDRTSNPTGIGDVTKTSRVRGYLNCILEENKSKGEEGVLGSCCSVTKLCPTFCDPMDCSTSCSPVLHYLPEFAQTHVYWVGPTISSSVVLFSSYPQSFPASGSFLMSQLFASGGQSIGASASVLPVSIQVWFPLGLTGLISLLSTGLSGVLSNTTIWKRRFFSAQPSLWASSLICTWLLEKL